MHNIENSVSRLCQMKDRIMTELESKYSECGTDECGKVVDMIKDLCEAEEKLWKAFYYKSVTEAMEECGEMDDEGRMGYDTWRYSSGRYAPKGRGTRTSVSKATGGRRMGFDPDMITPGPYYPDHQTWNDGWNANPTHPIDDYKMAKRHWTETHEDKDKKEMKQHGMSHIDETILSLKEIWNDADPELRAHLKEAVSKMVTDFK